MRPSPEPPAAWSAWLRALWGDTAQLAPIRSEGEGGRCVLTGTAPEGRWLHMPVPADGAGSWGPAAAAHAAAHWRHGGAPQPRRALKPVQLAILGVLEDARVESLALQELPGLRELWLPFHGGLEGEHAEALLARLSHALLDPRHADPHPWVAKALAAFHAGAPLRELASHLGNDLGQMRLAFNARSYQVHAAYRDDNSHLWEADPGQPPSPTPLTDGAGEGRTGEAGAQAAAATPIAYAEWDYRIGRYRAGWCQVRESEGAAAPMRRPVGDDFLRRRLSRSLASQRWGAPRLAGAAAWGDDFHPMALVDARVHQRLGLMPDARVYRALVPSPVRLSVLVLVDASASSRDLTADGVPLLDGMLAAAHACTAALEGHGHQSALMAFSSRTRAQVDLVKLKGWSEPAASAAVGTRCAGARAGGSTRLGAALRHATARVLEAGGYPIVLLLSDGEAHDVDVHDAAYLAHDFRRALREARSRGVDVRCVRPAALRRRRSLHQAMARLLGLPTIGAP